jgi:hypothetical protein
VTISVDAQLTPAADRPAVFEALRRAEERVREIATARAYEIGYAAVHAGNLGPEELGPGHYCSGQQDG